MSLETRSSSALFKRNEQLKRWEESETNKESGVIKNKERKVKFSSDCVFLAACGAGDKEEVQRLLQKGADINTTNVDGLTALHQACIDDNLEMVEFLVQNGADVNIGDNEGWTPLHATASCGFLSISKFLLENGANVACVNNDGHLPIDIADSDVMEELLNKHIYAQGIDCDQARNEEEQLMLHDAKEWLNSGGDAATKEVPHPKTGATALHVAAAKGYIKVMRVLIQAGCDVDAQDFDGWTPLHAAAHWCVGEACKLLVEDGLCDMDIRNYVGQTAFDVADSELHPPLEELKKRQAGLLGSKRRKKIETAAMDTIPQSPLEVEESALNDNSHKHRTIAKAQELENNRIPTNRAPQNVDGEIRDTNIESEEVGSGDVTQRVRRNPAIDDGAVHVDDEDEVLIDKREESDVGEEEDKEEEDSSSSLATSSSSSSTASSSETSDSSDECEARGSAEKNLSLEEKKNRVNREENVSSPTKNPTLNINAHPAPTSPPKVVPAENDDTPGTGSGPSWRRPVSYRGTATRPNSTPSPREETGTKKAATNRTSAPDSQQQQEVILRRTHSFESDEKKGGREDLRVKIGKTDAVTTPASTNSTTNAMSLSATFTSPLPSSQVRRSFVPPVRDEESETQRKAHAKRVRETRRSTQGVTLEELKSAEQLVRKQQQQQQHNDTNPQNNQSSQPETQQQQFLLEDARSRSGGETVSTPTSTSAYIRRPASASPSVLSTTTPSSATPRPASVPPEADATVTIALRRQSKPPDDKDQDKENDSRNAQATQAVIQRRRRPKRRSTGVVHVDMDEIDPDRQDSADADDSSKYNSEESGAERSGRSSRLGSSSSLSGDRGGDSASNSRPETPSHSENGELDYKKLWEESQAENERLRERLRKAEDELRETQKQLQEVASTQNNMNAPNISKSSLSEVEKREKRALERKLSEMEEELKQLQKLKGENERLKSENRSLTRVVSKLANSASSSSTHSSSNPPYSSSIYPSTSSAALK